jgi:hypothetical protein
MARISAPRVEDLRKQAPRLSELIARPFRLVRLSEQDRRFLWQALALAIAVRIGFLIIAYISGRALMARDVPLDDMLGEVLNRWDAPHFQYIAEHWYGSEGNDRLMFGFLPFYPVTIRALTYLVPSYLVAGLIISSVSSVAAGFLLQKLASLDSDEEEVNRTLWYFYLFPTAYFLFAPYAEALAITLIIASFLAARHKRWAWAGVAGMFATFTRLPTLALIPALAVEAVHQEGWRLWRAVWLALVPVGLLAFMAINEIETDDPFTYVDVNREFWGQKWVEPWYHPIHDVKAIFNEPAGNNRTWIIETRLVAFSFAALLLIAAARWLRPSYQVYAWTALTIGMITAMNLALPRHLLAIFPLYLILARFGQRPIVHQAQISTSGMLLGGLFIIYANGWWAF